MAFNNISQFSAALLELVQTSLVLLSHQPLLLLLLFPAILAIEDPQPRSAVRLYGRQLELKQYRAVRATGAFYSQTKKKSFGNLMRSFKITSQGPDLPR